MGVMNSILVAKGEDGYPLPHHKPGEAQNREEIELTVVPKNIFVRIRNPILESETAL